MVYYLFVGSNASQLYCDEGLAVHTCVGFEQRIKPLEEFMQDLKTGSVSRMELEQWNAGSFQMRNGSVG